MRIYWAGCHHCFLSQFVPGLVLHEYVVEVPPLLTRHGLLKSWEHMRPLWKIIQVLVLLRGQSFGELGCRPLHASCAHLLRGSRRRSLLIARLRLLLSREWASHTTIFLTQLTPPLVVGNRCRYRWGSKNLLPNIHQQVIPPTNNRLFTKRRIEGWALTRRQWLPAVRVKSWRCRRHFVQVVGMIVETIVETEHYI